MGSRPQRSTARTSLRVSDQEFVDDAAAELAGLWRVLSAAIAHDSAGQFRDQRVSTGAREGSAATVNVDVVDAAVVIETGCSRLAAEVVRIMNLNAQGWSTPSVIDAVPEWHRLLERRGLSATANYMRRDLRSWLRAAGQAIGTRQRDPRAGLLCPDHRDIKPTELRIEGDRARVADSLLAGPSPSARLMQGPVCSTCLTADRTDDPPNSIRQDVTSRRQRRRRRRADRSRHPSCELILDRRLVDDHGPSDWIMRAGSPAWSSLDGSHAFDWQHSAQLVCPHCRRAWSTPTEKRLLARELRAGGDTRTPALEEIIQ